jgi:hypothetical protein
MGWAGEMWMECIGQYCIGGKCIAALCYCNLEG